MEENIIETFEIKSKNTQNNNGLQQIAGAIVLAGILIAGAILIKGGNFNSNTDTVSDVNNPYSKIQLAKVNSNDKTVGNPNAKVTLIMYEDFQCPFCGAISGLQNNSPLVQALKQKDPSWTPFMTDIKTYINNGSVQLVYRDYAFLGPESIRSSEAARCADDQGKFWEYHDYLYGHQNGENKGGFADENLKSFAKILGLNENNFNNCLDSGKYAQAIADAKAEGDKAGVTGTPKGFILKRGKIVDTIEGAEPSRLVKTKIDQALK